MIEFHGLVQRRVVTGHIRRALPSPECGRNRENHQGAQYERAAENSCAPNRKESTALCPIPLLLVIGDVSLRSPRRVGAIAMPLHCARLARTRPAPSRHWL